MKNGRDLKDVLMELAHQNQLKRDFIAPAGKLRLLADGETFEMGGKENFSTTSLFHRQLGSALGIPAKYYDLMKAEKPELLANNVNAWLGERPNNYKVRALGDTARAFLSERYRRRDNLEIASAVLPLFTGGGYSVESCEVTEHRMYIKIVNQRLEMEVTKGDVVQAGVVISNSEVGLGAVSVQPLVYRLACTNGMIVCDMGQRKNHIGRQNTLMEDYSMYSDETLEAEDKAFLMKLKDVALAAIEENRFSMVVDRLRATTGMKITGDIQKVVELSSNSFGLSGDEENSVLHYLIEGGDLSLYGLSNAVTRTSQDIDSYDRATELEGIGWKMAAMKDTEWEVLNR